MRREGVVDVEREVEEGGDGLEGAWGGRMSIRPSLEVLSGVLVGEGDERT